MFFSCLLLASIIAVNAATLKKYTEYTYVNSSHPDYFTYVGEVSVRGADWIRPGGTQWYFPLFSKVTYRVPGDYDQYVQVVSSGPDDMIVRKDSIVVKDTLNPWANKTQVFWKIGIRVRDINPGDPEPYNINVLE